VLTVVTIFQHNLLEEETQKIKRTVQKDETKATISLDFQNEEVLGSVNIGSDFPKGPDRSGWRDTDSEAVKS
jgi:membrane carboxypeptidase/penicillin-binding protein PbpC